MRRSLLFIFLLSCCFHTYAQLIEVNPAGIPESVYTPEELIRNVLVSGSCATSNVSNVSAVVEAANDPSNRENKSYGYFRKDPRSDFPFEEGIILTTGRAYQAGNTMIPSILVADINSETDADLIAATGNGGPFLNTTSFEFTFSTSSDQISFRYIMASEEYDQNNTYPCSFADSFAFLLKPVGGTYENIALIPGSTDEISIVNVHPEIPGPTGCVAQNEEYFEGYNLRNTNYEGRTVVLTATSPVIPNTEYTIKLVIADFGDNQNDSAVFLEKGSFNLGLDLGEDFSIANSNAVCGATSQLLTANVTAPSYKWFKDGAEIPGETGQSYLANLGNGVYTCEIPSGSGCAESDDILVEFADQATINPTITNLIACDSDGDLITSINLREKDLEILNGQNPTDFEVRYFTDSAYTLKVTDALNYVNTNPTETIYVRVVNISAPNCLAEGSFTLQVTAEPTPTAPTPYTVCDIINGPSSDVDGFFQNFNLSTKDAEILEALDPALYSVSYHSTLIGAQTDNMTDVIDKTVPYTNTLAFDQTSLFVRVENILNPTCFSANTTLNLIVVPQPKASPMTTIFECVASPNQSFNLNTLKDTEVLDTQDPTVFNVVYYPSQADAQGNTNALTANTLNTTAYGIYTIWARVFHTANPTTCTDVNQAITSFEVRVSQDPNGLIQQPTDVSQCDNAIGGGTDTDGIINDFITLSSKDTEVLNNVAFVDPSLYTVSYHLSANEATTNQNPIDKLNPYTNATANQQTIYIRVEHNNDPSCAAFTNFDLIVHPLPVIMTPQELKQCDADANPNDGFSLFNLTEANSLFSANHANETFEYYGSQTGAENATASELINNPTSFQNRSVSTDTVWARISNNNGCFRVGQLNLVSSTSAIPNTITYRFNACDDFDGNMGSDTDGTTVFDFSTVDAQIRALFPQAVEVSYYQNEADSATENMPITNTSSFRNTLANTVGGSQIIWVRVESTLNEDCLGRSGYIELIVDPVPVETTVADLELCDDFQDGNGTNGFVQSFDLESQTAGILNGQSPANFTVTYHLSAADANSGASPQSSPFTNTIRDRQTIYVRITNNTTGCFTDHTTFDVVVNPLPIANFVADLEVCDDNTDGSARNGFAQGIDLEVQTPGILGSQDPNVFTVTYHGTLAEAQAGIVPLVSNNFSNSVPYRQTIYVRVFNANTQCANGISNFDVVVNPEPVFTPVSNLSLCDNDNNGNGSDTDGIREDIDLESVIPDLLAHNTVVQDPDDFNVSFHESQADATSGANPLPTTFYTNTTPDLQPIFVRIENKATGCVNDDATFNIIINPLPDFQVTTPQVVCLNGPTLTISVENPADVYDYVWTDPLGNDTIGSFLTVSSGGLYSVKATTTNGTNCSRTRTIQVNESIIATITQDDVTIVDDSDNNSITIDPTNLGIGDYEYALADENNIIVRSYQDQPLFDRLEGGFYNILVRDKNGCGEVSLLVSVVEFPKFFTPNNDGINDTWAVKGANSTFFPTSSIYIFNRYGKVVATLPIDSQGWNGEYGGNRLPSDDYWFSIRLVDTQGTVRERKGNFSLLRK